MENTVNSQNVDTEISAEEKKKTAVGRIINICLTVALFTFIIAFMFRMCQSSHKEFKELYITDSLKEAYAVSQDVRTHAAGTEFSENGALYAYSFVYIPDAKYMQITVRYNNRHIDEVINSLNNNEKIINGENAKSYTLDDISIFYALEDSKGKEYKPTVLDKKQKFNYTYFKLEFTDVDFNDTSLNVNMLLENTEQKEINGKNTLAYSLGSIYNSGTLECHSKDDMHIPYELSKSERKELALAVSRQ